MSKNDGQRPIVLGALERIVRAEVGLTAIAMAGIEFGPDLPILQWRALVAVVDGGADLRIRDVAAGVGIALPSASRLVRRLERRGLVTTYRDEDDRRVTRVHATERGRALFHRVVEARQAIVEKALANGGAPLPGDLELGLVAIAERLEALPLAGSLTRQSGGRLPAGSR